MSLRSLGVALIAIGMLGLAGCGRQAELDRPQPLVSKPPQPSAEALARDQAAARARADTVGADPVAPQTFDEVRNLGSAKTPTPPPSAVPLPPASSAAPQ